jgi:hypothetical protein
LPAAPEAARRGKQLEQFHGNVVNYLLPHKLTGSVSI